jgi:PAS domain S-box-containing protein
MDMKKITNLIESSLVMKEFIGFLENSDLTGKSTVVNLDKALTRQNNEKYLEELENRNKAIWIINNEGKNIFVSARSAKLFGYKEEEIIGEYLFNFMDEPAQNNALLNFTNRKQDGVDQVKFISKKGEPFSVEIENHTLYDRNGKVSGRIAIMTEI